MMGSPDAPHVIVCLLDYTCIHCRALHPILVQMSEQFSNQLAFVSLPMPLSSRCNPNIHGTSPSALHACEYAHLSLAVWRAKPSVFHQFDEWMFATVNPPPLEAAEAYAAQLVGTNELQSASADPWIEQQIGIDCEIHHANWLAVDSAALPQLTIGDAVSSGPINSVQQLEVLINKYLGLNLQLNGF